jgi:hypothetical protein
MVVPVKTFINTEVATEGQNIAGQYSTRRTLFIIEYNGYASTASAH